MARINILACDGCDCRDNLLHPSTNGVRAVHVVVTQAEVPPITYDADLCSMCVSSLQEQIVKAISQKPRQA